VDDTINIYNYVYIKIYVSLWCPDKTVL
jgi:hypothetical protein